MFQNSLIYFDKKKSSFFLISFFLLIALFLIKFVVAYQGFPISLGDKEGFYPVTFNYAINNKFIHPFICYTCENITDNPLERPFNNHGFLFPLISGELFLFDNYERIETSNIILFLINGVLFIAIIRVNTLKLFLIFLTGRSEQVKIKIFSPKICQYFDAVTEYATAYNNVAAFDGGDSEMAGEFKEGMVLALREHCRKVRVYLKHA